MLLDPAERAAIAEHHLDHLAIDDDPGVEPEPRGMLGMGQPPQPVAAQGDPPEPVIGLQRIAAGRDEIEHPFPRRRIDPGVGLAGPDLGQQIGRGEGPGAGAGHDVLGQHVEPAGAERLAVALALLDRLFGGKRLEEFKPIARHQQRPTGLIEPVVGPPDPLQQSRAALGRAHLHHQVDIAPVDPQIEARRGDQRAQFATRHRAFDLAPRLLGKRAVMDPDRQQILVRLPQLLENELGQEPGVAEDQRGAVAVYLVVQLWHRPGSGVSTPWHPCLVGQQDRKLGRRALLTRDHGDLVRPACRRQPGGESLRISQRGG